jgi:hypothetical protein
MCLFYKNEEGKYIGIYITGSEHFRNKGEIYFCFLDFEVEDTPDLQMFAKGKLYGLEKLGDQWKTAIYRGNVMGIIYEKDTKDLFFDTTAKAFKISGSLKPADGSKWINNIKSGFMHKGDSGDLISRIERVRLETKKKFAASDITLTTLLDSVGLD